MKTKERVEVKREDLLRVLESVQPGIVTGRESIEQGTCFCFLKNAVATFNETVACRAPLNGKSGLSDFPVRGAVRAEKLLDVLRKTPLETLGISQTDTDLVLHGRNHEFEFALDRQVVLPLEVVEEPEDWTQLPDDFAEAVGRVGKCTSDDDGVRPYTPHVHLTPEFVEAASNAQACRWHLVTGLKEVAIVPWTALKQVLPLGMGEFSETSSWLHFRNAQGLVVSCRKYLDDYPNLIKMFQVKGRLTKLPKVLASHSQYGEIFSKEDADGNRVTVELTPGKVRIKAGSVYGRFKGWTTKVEYDGPKIDFRMEPGLLAEIVKEYGDRIEVTEDRMIVRGKGWVYLACLLKTLPEVPPNPVGTEE